MTHFIESSLISVILAFCTTLLFYEILCIVMRAITQSYLSPRLLLMILALGIFIAHTLSIVIYGFAYWILVKFLNYPPLEGVDTQLIGSYLYYSATTYSSLGVGDIFARGSFRLITSIEVINGLTLIAWSATFTYFAVQKMWNAHGLFMEVKCKNCDKNKLDES